MQAYTYAHGLGLVPAFSEWIPTQDLLYTPDEAKADLGTFDDPTYERAILDLIMAAQEYADRIVDGPIAPTARVDFYCGLYRLLVLSWRPTDADPITLRFRTAGETVEFSTLVKKTDNDDLLFDASDGPPAVVFTDAGWERAGDVLKDTPLSGLVRNPVSIAYKAGVLSQSRGEHAPKQAIKDMVLSTFQQGDTEISMAAKARARDMLAPYEIQSV